MLEEKKIKIQLSQRVGANLNRFFKAIILLIIIAVLALGYFMVIKDQYKKLQKSQKIDLVQLQNTINRLAKDNTYMTENIDKSIEFSPAEERLLSLALPDQFDFPSLIVQLGSLAGRYGFTVANIDVKEVVGIAKPKSGDQDTDESQNPSPPEDNNSQLKKVNVEIAVVGGSYDAFKNFIQAMENSVMLFDVLSVNFKAEDIAAQKYSLDFVTYYFKEKVK
ncbi:hypothetical protein HZA71_01320 [Candidatus Falkowbacteria bacterium]|nr:hypothetical protein [Candidatus Falkowbacteria bacterium]